MLGLPAVNAVKMLKLLPKYGDLTSDRVTPEIVAEFAQEANLAHTAEGVAAVAESIRQGDLDTLSDYLGEPQRLKSLVTMLAGVKAEPAPVLCKCPHCAGLFELTVDVA